MTLEIILYLMHVICSGKFFLSKTRNKILKLNTTIYFLSIDYWKGTYVIYVYFFYIYNLYTQKCIYTTKMYNLRMNLIDKI